VPLIFHNYSVAVAFVATRKLAYARKNAEVTRHIQSTIENQILGHLYTIPLHYLKFVLVQVSAPLYAVIHMTHLVGELPMIGSICLVQILAIQNQNSQLR